ncbi:MAG: F-type H+-transporting ATPase subunit AtpI [Rhodobacteraceae bacterium HLUCCA12]|nr:MAG: F-type H+-transporting ATPase subunit AtpI [Rhodobacteraceae bacterium HLUCCA12]
MSEPNDLERLKALDQRIERLRAAKAPPPKKADSHDMAHHAWRMVTELVAGLLIGLGIGYGLDRLFGTGPLFLVLFILLGFAAGVRVMMRTAGELQRESEEGAEKSARDRGEKDRG